jgi:hypothetical protein
MIAWQKKMEQCVLNGSAQDEAKPVWSFVSSLEV